MVKKTAKKPTKTTKPTKKPATYSSGAYKRHVKADTRARRKAEDLAKLPKNPIARFFAKLHPRRFFKFWFSRDGLFCFLKILAAGGLVAIIIIGGLFLYFKKEADACGDIPDQVADTVNTYLDRNGTVLWEDKGDGDYRLTVDGADISTYMRQATVAREDKNFYTHIGVDFVALVRAAFMTLSGQSVQGGSTLTQQLVKQVCFAAEASNRDLSGLPRKIKEVIVALEVEKMYDKEQIISLYLNESPYGGRRNGVESGAQTYFGKSSKDLSLAEAALLATIPNNPAWLDPYNIDANEDLIYWQHYTLDNMVDMGYITAEESQAAKDVPILDQIIPEASQYQDIKAPWFVLEVKKQLEEKYGVGTIRAGGFTIKTTLDYRAQQLAETAIDHGEALFSGNRSDNATLVSVDVETGQIIAMAGSIDWNTPVYGQVNAATSLLQPASSIKPVLDYLPLFMQRDGQNFGPGSIIRDENIDSIYCAGSPGRCQLRNFSGSFYGNQTIRNSLGNSLNIGAVKALYVNGMDNSLEVLHDLGDVSYCTQPGEYATLAIGIGSGCRVRPVEHANTFASVARGGVYRPLAYWLEIKNSSGDVIDRWEDVPGERVVDEQVAYMVTDILGDPNARNLVFGSMGRSFGFNVPGVWTASKTGTSDDGNRMAKDSWMVSYSPVISTVVWNGNHDGRSMGDSNTVVRRIVNDYMEPVHKEIYGPEGRWTANQRVARPAGIQELSVSGGRKDIWPSWYSTKTSGIEQIKITIDATSLMLASACTPSYTRREITITKTIDPMTKSDIFTIGGDSFTEEQKQQITQYWKDNISDNTHECGQEPTLGANTGTDTAFSVSLTTDGSGIAACEVTAGTTVITSNCTTSTITATLPAGTTTVKVYVRTTAGYENSRTYTIVTTPPAEQDPEED